MSIRTNSKSPSRHKQPRNQITPQHDLNPKPLRNKTKRNRDDEICKSAAPELACMHKDSHIAHFRRPTRTADHKRRVHDALQPSELLLHVVDFAQLLWDAAVALDGAGIVERIVLLAEPELDDSDQGKGIEGL